MRIVFTLLILGTAAVAAPAEAQVLNVRPAPFADLRPGRQARYGEVVLGQTTLAGALRMFAEHLRSDSVKVPRGHGGNPSSWPAGTVWLGGAHEIRPRHHLDLGPDRYQLYFDENERLITASTGPRLPGGLTWQVLSKHHPSLRKGRRWYSGDQPLSDTWSVVLSSCVTLAANVLIAGQRVQSLSYHYTCPTTSTGTGKTASSR
ncbi:MAG TPA: hypothetical protein VE420_05015 [Gemmatimonadales bacterium]|nr:hypothetical protein [Gemmatimonadales bacterium]